MIHLVDLKQYIQIQTQTPYTHVFMQKRYHYHCPLASAEKSSITLYIPIILLFKYRIASARVHKTPSSRCYRVQEDH
jgi:hypothetical protein